MQFIFQLKASPPPQLIPIPTPASAHPLGDTSGHPNPPPPPPPQTKYRHEKRMYWLRNTKRRNYDGIVWHYLLNWAIYWQLIKVDRNYKKIIGKTMEIIGNIPK